MATINSTWAQLPIVLTLPLTDPVWDDAGKMKIPGGFLMTKNDGQFLYAALDVTADKGNDPGTGDYFWFTFDRNRNGSITPNFDTNYGLYPGSPNKMGRQFYLSPGSWTGLSQDSSSCHQSFEASPNAAAAHRVWKFRFALSDLNVSLAPWWWASYTKFGIKLHSNNPRKDYITPANFWQSFTKLHRLYFSRKPVVDTSSLGPVIGSVGLIPTTKINASGRATTAAGYYVHVENAAFGGLLNVIGNGPKRQALWNAGARKIKVLHSEGSGGFTEFSTAWYNYKWSAAAGDYELESFGPDGSNFYPLQNPSIDYSIDDLLFQFDSGRLPDGIHNFQVRFYTARGVLVPTGTRVQTLKILVDNTLPVVKINNIFHGRTAVAACDIVKMTGPRDGVSVNFDAVSASGNLAGWSLSAGWGDGAGATIGSGSYVPGSGNWTGVTNHREPATGQWVPPVKCAYAFTIKASARVTNGYSYIGHTSVSRHITIDK